MESEEESEHEVELCKNNQPEARMFYLPIYHHIILYECFGMGIQIMSVVLLPPGIYRQQEIILKFTLISYMLPTLCFNLVPFLNSKRKHCV